MENPDPDEKLLMADDLISKGGFNSDVDTDAEMERIIKKINKLTKFIKDIGGL